MLTLGRRCHGCGAMLGDAIAAVQVHVRTCPAVAALRDFV